MKRRILLLMVPLLVVGFAFSVNLLNGAEGKTKILKFEADWCGPCRQMKPIYSKVAHNFSSDASFQSINVDRNPTIADRYSVRSLPTVVAVKNGRVVGRKTGFMNEQALSAFVKRHR
jgi:thioredoxin